MKHDDKERANEASTSEGVSRSERSGSFHHSATSSRKSTASDDTSSSFLRRTEVDAQKAMNEISYQLSKLTNESPRTVTGRLQVRGSRIQKEDSIDSLTKLSAARIRSERRLVKSSSRTDDKFSAKPQTVPQMYTAAMAHDWVNVACRTITHPSEARFVHAVDGTTLLHLAVVSRASYADCVSLHGQSIRKIWQDCKLPANLELIHALVKLNPNVLKRRCKRLGYTPLIYALMQPRIDNYGKETEDLIRLLVECGEDSLRIPTTIGLSPFEAYITSYSQVHGTLLFTTTKDEDEAKKTTNILNFLLQYYANVRQEKQNQVDSVDIGSLLEVLYESNSSSLLHAAECSSISSSRNNTLAMSELNGWWVWQWLLVLLRHSMNQEESRHFSPTHAAAALENGCPLPMLMLLMRAFPIQVRIPCPTTNTNRYVLHYVCCWGGIEPSPDDAINYSRKQMAISATLREFPAAAAVTEGEGRTALCLALRHRTLWRGGVSKLYKAFPGALHIADPQTGLYPFMTAATAAPQMQDVASSRSITYKDYSQIETIFELLRAAPEVLSNRLDDENNNEETESFLEFRRAAEQQSLSQILQHWPVVGEQQQSPFQIDSEI